MADLSSFKPNTDVIEVILTEPDGDPILKDDGKEMSITVYSPFSKEFKEVQYEQTDKRLNKASKNRKIVLTAKEIDEASIELLSHVTKSWDIQLSDKCPKLTIDAAYDLYSTYPWIKEQVEEAINSASSFTKA
jgi:hypothetical protein